MKLKRPADRNVTGGKAIQVSTDPSRSATGSRRESFGRLQSLSRDLQPALGDRIAVHQFGFRIAPVALDFVAHSIDVVVEDGHDHPAFVAHQHGGIAVELPPPVCIPLAAGVQHQPVEVLAPEMNVVPCGI